MKHEIDKQGNVVSSDENNHYCYQIRHLLITELSHHYLLHFKISFTFKWLCF